MDKYGIIYLSCFVAHIVYSTMSIMHQNFVISVICEQEYLKASSKKAIRRCGYLRDLAKIESTLNSYLKKESELIELLKLNHVRDIII